MKTVFTGAEVPHVFATQSQTRGRNSGDSLWFEGPTLYSYREPIARFYGDIALTSADSFSVTTSNHQSWTRYALRHIETVDVPALKRVCEILDRKSEREALEYIKARLVDIGALEEALPRKRSDWKIRETRRQIAMHETACEPVWRAIGKRSDWRKRAVPDLEKKMRAERRARYERALGSLTYMIERGHVEIIDRMRKALAEGRGVRHFVFATENALSVILRADSLGARRGETLATAAWSDARQLMGKAWAESYRDACARLEALAAPIENEARKMRENLAEVERAENAERLEKWLAGENVAAPRLSEVFCRVVGDEVQTSHGARVPLQDALRVVRIAAKCREDNREFSKETFATGIYRGIRVDTSGNVKIGCHDITWRGISEAVARFMPDLARELVAEPC